MTVGDAILSLVDKIVSRKKLSVILIVLINIIVVRLELSREQQLNEEKQSDKDQE